MSQGRVMSAIGFIAPPCEPSVASRFRVQDESSIKAIPGMGFQLAVDGQFLLCDIVRTKILPQEEGNT